MRMVSWNIEWMNKWFVGGGDVAWRDSHVRSESQYRHAVVDRVPDDHFWTAVFDDFVDEIPDRHVLLDHDMVSPSLADRLGDAEIAHVAWANALDPTRPDSARDHAPSDHRPVVADLV